MHTKSITALTLLLSSSALALPKPSTIYPQLLARAINKVPEGSKIAITVAGNHWVVDQDGYNMNPATNATAFNPASCSYTYCLDLTKRNNDEADKAPESGIAIHVANRTILVDEHGLHQPTPEGGVQSHDPSSSSSSTTPTDGDTRSLAARGCEFKYCISWTKRDLSHEEEAVKPNALAARGCEFKYCISWTKRDSVPEPEPQQLVSECPFDYCIDLQGGEKN